MSYVLWDLAKTSDDQIVWISQDCKDDLFCVECSGKMIPIKGEIKQHHFRHSAEGNCSGESAQHWSKKYEIHQTLEKIGSSAVEGAIGKFYADVLFEKEWAFEVVYSNPPSEEKMNALKERLIIFNFNDDYWGDDTEGLLEGRSLEEMVTDIATSILKGDAPDVCSNCREVKGWMSRLKSNREYGPCCMPCDFDWFCRN
jgi:hypothetical protein